MGWVGRGEKSFQRAQRPGEGCMLRFETSWCRYSELMKEMGPWEREEGVKSILLE